MSSGGPPERDDSPFPRIGAYQLLEPVGAGGSGVVYRARDHQTGRLVALKTARSLDVGELRSLRREVHALGRMRHPGVVRIIEHGVSDGIPWYTMELLAGETLRQWLSSHPRDGSGRVEALRMLARLCDALAFIHGEGVVHRDLKPENIFLDQVRGPVLVDFGLVSQFAGPIARERLDAVGAGWGSLDYMAPEQLHGGSVDARADLYSLGCVLYEILAGRPPFPGGQWTAAPPPPLDDEVPEALRQLVPRLLTWRARQRLGHVIDVLAVLASVDGSSLDLGPSSRGYLYRPGFVGRDDVVATLAAAFEASRHGRGDALWIGGPSGTGKTRLVTEAVALAAARGHRVVVSECEPLGAAQPLSALRPLVQAIADHCRVEGQGEADRILGPRAGILAAHWPELGTLPRAHRYPEPPPLAGRAGRERLFEALADTILCFAERTPLVLVFDDLQWADEMTLELLDRLEADQLCDYRIVLVCTFRSDDTDDSLRRRLEGRRGTLRLQPLDASAIGSIIADMLALDGAPPRLVDAVAAHAEGNPLFVAEYLRAAVGQGLVRRDRLGRWHVPDATGPERVVALDVPLTLRALILHRIARLSDGARRVAERASVLGREFPFDWLEGFSGLPEAETLDAINELIVGELVESVAHGRLRFAHDKFREVAYAGLPAATLAELHRAAARLIEARAGGRRELYAALARHYAIAGVDDKTFEYLERAAEYALELGAHLDAIALLHQALALASRTAQPIAPARSARLHQQLGEAAFAVGDLRRCQEHLGQVVALLHGALPRSRPRWAALLMVETARQALGLLRPTRAAARRLGDAERDRAAALAAAKIAEAAYFTGDVLVMLSANVLAANLAERAGSEAEVPRAYAQIGYTAGFFRLGALATRYFGRARGPAVPPARDGTRACVSYIEALYHLGFGRWTAAENAARDSIVLLASAGDRQENEIAQTMLAQAEYFSGRFTAAQSRFLVVRDSAQARRNQQHQAWGCYGAARSLLALGRTVEAAQLLGDADALLRGQADHASDIICNGLWAMAALYSGDGVSARQRADRALLQLGSAAPMVFSTIHGYDGALEVYRAAAASDPAALAAARRTLGLLRSFSWSFPMARPSYLRHRAWLLQRDGRHRQARRSAERAFAAARRLSMPLEAALAALALGASGLLPPDAAYERLLRAKASLSTLGCEYHLRLCQTELERVERERRSR